MEGKIMVDTREIAELARLISEIKDRIESLELMGNKKFMTSLKKSKEQIKKREFADWNVL